jgi:hypothetical protein
VTTPTPTSDGCRVDTTGSPAAEPVVAVDIELLDRLIQRIFAAGLDLERTTLGASRAATRSVRQAIDHLDMAIHDIQSSALAASMGDRSTRSEP